MEFVILGFTAKDKEKIKKDLISLGAKVITKISKSVMAVISTEEEVEKMNARMTSVKDEDVHVVSEKFIKSAKKYIGKIPELVKKTSICDWGSDVSNNALSILIYRF